MADCLPRFIQILPESSIVSIGGQLRLEVRLIGIPNPEVSWYKDNVEVYQDNSHTFENFQDGVYCLNIDDALLRDDGEYECRVRNCMGQVSCFCEVQVQVLDANQQDDERLSEGRQSGIFILFDEGSQDEEEEGIPPQVARRSLTASEQIEGIIEDLTNKKKVKMEDRPKIKDIDNIGSPCQSPTPLRRTTSATSSIDLDASLRITEVTSPTEMLCDHQPLVREDSVESRDKSDTWDEKEKIIPGGLQITEMEDDTIMEEDEEEEEEDDDELFMDAPIFNKPFLDTVNEDFQDENNDALSSDLIDRDTISRDSNLSGQATPVNDPMDSRKVQSIDSGFGKETPEDLLVGATQERKGFTSYQEKSKCDLKLDFGKERPLVREEELRDGGYELSDKVGFEITREKYEDLDVEEILAKYRKDTKDVIEEERSKDDAFNRSSKAIEEVEDIFEKSKKELESILDITRSKSLLDKSKNLLRIGSDEELEDEIDRIKREMERKRKLDVDEFGSLLRRKGDVDFGRDLFDVKKSKKVEDLFEKSKEEMKEYLQEVKKSRDEFFGVDLKDDELFFKSSVFRPIEELGERSFRTDKGMRDMKRRWKNEVGRTGKEITSEMGLTWPPTSGLWIESSDESDTSGSFGLGERRLRSHERAEAEMIKDKFEQADDDTSKLDDESINDESIDGFEEKEMEGHLPLDGCPIKMSVTRSYESHSYTKSADYFEQSFEYSHATSGAREKSSKSKTFLSFSESFDDDSKSEPVSIKSENDAKYYSKMLAYKNFNVGIKLKIDEKKKRISPWRLKYTRERMI